MRTFKQFVAESDDFVLAWNQATSRQTEMRPIPSTFRRFHAISTAKPPAGMPRSCYMNSLENFKKKGWKMVTGFAMPEEEAQRVIKTGEVHPINPRFRGYDHAWNIDDKGAVIDSTYRADAPNYRYYGIVVPNATAHSFGQDKDVEHYIQQQNDAHSSPRNRSHEKWHREYYGSNSLHQIEVPPTAVDNKIKAKGYKFHSLHGTSRGGKTEYLYVNIKGNKLYATVDDKTGAGGNVSVIPQGKYGEGMMRTWRTLEDWLTGARPIPQRR